MPISRDEAANALRDITQTERRSGEAYGYQRGAPHLIVWGVIWAIGYSLSFFQPHWQLTWPVLSIAGVCASFWLGARARSSGESGSKYLFTLVAIVIFIAALFSVFPPRSGAQVGAFFPLLAALFYAIVGIWANGRRLIMLSALIVALTLIGFFYLPVYFALWMALVGGGGLILGGLWLRSV
ncbi:MAG TPA: hypothetical protein VGU69_12290 [Rhizomicrobium sp.]|nr:hypothetical protein [Rhizomicrobium sp.]